MRLQWRPQFERFWFQREIPQPHQPPIVATLPRQQQLIDLTGIKKLQRTDQPAI
jgi:hypothetical protein